MSTFAEFAAPDADEPVSTIELTDKLAKQLRELGYGLRPAGEEDRFFFEIVRDLVFGAVTNYELLVQGYRLSNNNLVAWACRNLLEIGIFTKYVLASRENALLFRRDRIADACSMAEALKEMELRGDPHGDMRELDHWMSGMEMQIGFASPAEARYLSISELADQVGMAPELRAIDRICGNLVHPMAWSVLAKNGGKNCFPRICEALFVCAAGYMTDMFLAVKFQNTEQGMKPNP
jgi:hypothetical protein